VRASLLSIEALLDDSIALDVAASAVGVDRNDARHLLAELASRLPAERIHRMCLGAYEHRVRTENRKTRTR